MRQFLEEGLAASTRKVYKAGWNRYIAFTGAFKIPPSPLTTEKVTLFVAYLGSEGLSISTIQSYMAALRHFLILADPGNSSPSFHSPHMAILLRGIKRCQSLQGPKTIRLPVTASIMRRIKSVLAREGALYYNVLTWAACCVGFFGFLRCGEFLVPDGSDFDPNTHLSLSDISLDTSGNNWRFTLSLKVSKTDQFRKGALVVLGTTNSDLCPVAALLDYLALRGQIPGALFCLEDGRPLKRRVFTASVQQALTSSGLIGTQFNGHSFRIGAATTASAVGLPDSTIKSLGRWSSDAFQGYIRPSPGDLAGVASLLASKEPPP